jgi:hypothetical protein
VVVIQQAGGVVRGAQRFAAEAFEHACAPYSGRSSR